MNRLLPAAVVAALIAIPGAASAETRGKPYSEEQLLERSATVFVGEVLETRAYPGRGLSVPTRVRVLLSLKGGVTAGDRDVTPKDPGKHVYFDEEFSPAGKGDTGVFYVGADGAAEQLLGYRRIGK